MTNDMPEEIFVDDKSWYTPHPHMYNHGHTLTKYIRADLTPKPQEDLGEAIRETFERGVRQYCAGRPYDADEQLRKKPNGEYKEKAIYAAFEGFKDGFAAAQHKPQCADWRQNLIAGFPWDNSDDSLKRSYACQEAGLLTLEDTEEGSFDREEYGETVFRLTKLGDEMLARTAPLPAPPRIVKGEGVE